MEIMNGQPNILVVDDQPINVKLLQRKLERDGMAVQVAYNGRECLSSVESNLPDLILLDIMMPEMDGIEVCKILKGRKETQAIPIIFITAKSSKEGKLEGLDAGAVDYITKPIDLEETLARVRTQLRIQQIHRQNLELQHRLADSRQSATVGAITHGISHNLNNLLGVVVGYLDLVKATYDKPEMVERSVNLIEKAIQRMVNIVRQLSSIASEEKITLTPIPMANLIQSSLDRFREECNITEEIVIENNLGNKKVPANAEVFENILGKLLINAFESYPDNAESREVTLRVSQVESHGEDHLEIKILDKGSGIDEEIADHMFEPFTSMRAAVGRGMGLTIARHGARSLGGDLNITNNPDGGACATLLLPIRA